MEKIVDKKGLVKDIKKRFGNLYTVPYIEKMIEEEGCSYFSKYGTTYEYLGFDKWKIARTEQQ